MLKRKGYCELMDLVVILVLIWLIGAGTFAMLTSGRFSKADRKISVYDYGGNLIKHWEGEFALHSDGYETYFDYEGRRVIVRGGIVIAE